MKRVAVHMLGGASAKAGVEVGDVLVRIVRPLVSAVLSDRAPLPRRAKLSAVARGLRGGIVRI